MWVVSAEDRMGDLTLESVVNAQPSNYRIQLTFSRHATQVPSTVTSNYR
jgi:hypothetical protein